MSRTEATLATTVRVQLSAETLARYEKEAQRLGRSVEEVLARRLTACRDHDADKPLYFDDKDRQELERYLGRNVLNVGDALIQVRNAMAVRVNKVTITLSLGLLQRLKSRAIRVPFDDFLTDRVREGLERYVGLR